MKLFDRKKNDKKKVIKKADYEYLFNSLYSFVIIFFVASTVFDLAVTFTVAHYNLDFFLENEGNYILTKAVRDGTPLTTSATMVLHYLFFFLLVFVHGRFKKTQSLASGVILAFLMYFLLMLSVLHFVGGYSWWVASIGLQNEEASMLNSFFDSPCGEVTIKYNSKETTLVKSYCNLTQPET